MIFNEPSRTKKTLTLIIALLLSLFFLNRCAVNPVTGQRELMLVSEEQEIRMGQEFYPTALWTGEGGGGEYKDERAKTYLVQVISRIQCRLSSGAGPGLFYA